MMRSHLKSLKLLVIRFENSKLQAWNLKLQAWNTNARIQ
ncbi:hypothetical protein COO91_05609 [Nostoc flagelliforme CCNUN1]|uniref:Uncharacterized protein n=1 Tax=Nostoc flagelliforme CCNUN1 TaxID=2038116 RepID=A0A2K8SVW7_9NOSO|nr:hypothetical protein COO91_05609 [Nostoc flagelliforme CCNUN1]